MDPVRRSGQAATLLVHSGALYPEERDPRALYGALAELKRSGKVDKDSLKLVLRSTGHDRYHKDLVVAQGIDDIVSVEPALPYRAALREMLDADGLLVLQAANCNHQVPAKIYEYLRARRPILALTDPSGDTAAVLKSIGAATPIPLDDREAIERGLLRFLESVRSGKARVASTEDVRRHSRLARTDQLDALLRGILGNHAGTSDPPSPIPFVSPQAGRMRVSK
jgi:hypothetical protein